MDTTTTAIILLFVVSIFGGFGSNKGYKQPTATSSPPGVVYTQVSVTTPAPSFSAADATVNKAVIESYIKRYRSPEEAAMISSSIMTYSQTYDMNPKLVAALIARESKFNPRAVSSSGAMGLGQLLPSTAKGLNISDGFDIDQNAKGTVRYMKALVDRFKGNVSSAIAAYLEGPNAVDRNGGYSDKTKSYVEDILTIYQKI
ncbi:MAG: lytic transglycosylase domain-containing protein [Candidatus Margulisbacteria bacterium]|nr:lytic transglycosylase domain-containing protein [Candidatus Margulisiibacteriota bacterium]